MSFVEGEERCSDCETGREEKEGKVEEGELRTPDWSSQAQLEIWSCGTHAMHLSALIPVALHKHARNTYMYMYGIASEKRKAALRVVRVIEKSFLQNMHVERSRMRCCHNHGTLVIISEFSGPGYHSQEKTHGESLRRFTPVYQCSNERDVRYVWNQTMPSV
jgi:hypothetical protein